MTAFKDKKTVPAESVLELTDSNCTTVMVAPGRPIEIFGTTGAAPTYDGKGWIPIGAGAIVAGLTLDQLFPGQGAVRLFAYNPNDVPAPVSIVHD